LTLGHPFKLIPEPASALLSLFTIDVSPGAWWLVVNEFCEVSSSAEILAAVKAIEDLSLIADANANFGDALIEIGCYYWPGDGVSYAAWLKDLAGRLRDEVDRKTGG